MQFQARLSNGVAIKLCSIDVRHVGPVIEALKKALAEALQRNETLGGELQSGTRPIQDVVHGPRTFQRQPSQSRPTGRASPH